MVDNAFQAHYYPKLATTEIQGYNTGAGYFADNVGLRAGTEHILTTDAATTITYAMIAKGCIVWKPSVAGTERNLTFDTGANLAADAALLQGHTPAQGKRVRFEVGCDAGGISYKFKLVGGSGSTLGVGDWSGGIHVENSTVYLELRWLTTTTCVINVVGTSRQGMKAGGAPIAVYYDGVPSVAITDGTTLTAGASGTTHIGKALTLDSSAGTVTVTLPAVDTKTVYSFVVKRGGNQINISPAAADQIIGLGLTAADNKDFILASPQAGDSLQIAGLHADGWVVLSASGTWTREA